MEIEKDHSPANYISRATHIRWMEIRPWDPFNLWTNLLKGYLAC